MFFAIIFFGILIYIVEGQAFSNAILGMEWATKTLLGLNVADPETVFGRILLVVTRFIGLALFGLLIHIMGSFLRKAFFGNKKI